MCGVVAYYTEDPSSSDKDKLTALIQQSKIRGLHSFGISYLKNNKIITQKCTKYEELEIPETNLLIYHNRYTTSGDYKKPINNQPLELDKTYLSFNGVIHMGTKQGMEARHNIKMKSSNDGELFLHYLQAEDPVEILSNLKCSFAGAYIKNEKIYCIRNNFRPLWVEVEKKSVFISSTADIFKRSGFNNYNPVITNRKIELKEFIHEKGRIQKISYPNDAKWGYRPSIQLPTLHSS